MTNTRQVASQQQLVSREQQHQHQQNPIQRFLTNRASMKLARSNATTMSTRSSSVGSFVLEETGVSAEMMTESTPAHGTEVVIRPDAADCGVSVDAALQHMRRGAYHEALETLEAALQQEHPSKRTLIQYCSLMVHLELSTEVGDHHDAQAELIWKVHMENIDLTALALPPATVKLFHFFCKKEEWRQALRLARDINGDAIDDEILGEIFYNVGTSTATPHDEAVECLEQAFALMKHKHEAYTALLQSLAASHELTRATVIHEKYLQGLTSPAARSTARLELAECLIADCQVEHGLMLIHQGLEECPNCLPLLHAKAEVFLHRGRTREALDLYEHMLIGTEGSLEQTKILYALSKIHLRLKLPMQAIQYSKRELKLTKKLLGKSHVLVARIYSHLGRIYDSTCDYDEAITFYNKALLLETQELNRLKHACLWTSNETQMESYDSQMADVRHVISQTKKLLGKIHYKTGNWKGAFDASGMSR